MIGAPEVMTGETIHLRQMGGKTKVNEWGISKA